MIPVQDPSSMGPTQDRGPCCLCQNNRAATNLSPLGISLANLQTLLCLHPLSRCYLSPFSQGEVSVCVYMQFSQTSDIRAPGPQSPLGSFFPWALRPQGLPGSTFGFLKPVGPFWLTFGS